VSKNTDSYRALVMRLRALDSTVFTPAEAQCLRDAADARLFGDPDHVETATHALDMLDDLVAAARLSSRTSEALAELLCDIESVSAVS
jgi:hypothetical protein